MRGEVLHIADHDWQVASVVLTMKKEGSIDIG